MSKKQFRYLKPGDKVYVVDCDNLYISEVVDIKFQIGEYQQPLRKCTPNEFHSDDNLVNKFTDCGFMKYKDVDELPDDISTEYGHCHIIVTLKNHNYSEAEEKLKDSIGGDYEEHYENQETWKFISNRADDSTYSFRNYIYVFSSIEDIQSYRNHEYDIVVKPWDDILTKAKQL